jgi:hypothetical protein
MYISATPSYRDKSTAGGTDSLSIGVPQAQEGAGYFARRISPLRGPDRQAIRATPSPVPALRLIDVPSGRRDLTSCTYFVTVNPAPLHCTVFPSENFTVSGLGV